MSVDADALLDFAAKRDSGSVSWERADPMAAFIETVAWNRWHALLPDGEDTHEVRLERDHGAYLGDCHALTDDGKEVCRGFDYHDGPCAHLCTVRKAAVVDLPDVEGRPVTIHDVEDVEAERADHAIEKARADGGRWRGERRR